VPPTAARILDLGCSSGRLGAALKARQGAKVVGIEADPEYAREATARIDQVLVADLEELAPERLELGEFDCLIAADVLEHLRDPWSVLSRFVSLLGVGGTAVISLPNVRYWETFWLLVRYGVWPRRDEGIFDHDHLRWFTLADALALMGQAGLDVTRVNPRYRLRPSRPESERQARALRRTPLAPFLVFQYVLAGVRIGPIGEL
jgi:methionine biosynthesis protein MetW